MKNLDLLYGTLDDPEQWTFWLKHTCNLLRSDGGSVVVTSHRDGNVLVVPDERNGTPIMIQTALTAAELEAYLGKFAPIDFHRLQLMDMEVGDAAALSTLPESVGSRYRECQFFQEFAKETCLRNFMGGPFLRDERWLGNFGFYRYRLEDPFLPEEVAFVACLNADAHRVLLQSDYTALLEDAVGALSGSVDAIYLVDQHGCVQYANAAAGRLARKNCLTVQDGRLVTSDVVGTSKLNAAIAAFLKNPEVSVVDDFVIGGEAFPPLLVSVSPNRRKRPFIQAGLSTTHVVVTVRDPQAAPELNRRALARVYQLTSRELDICELLVARVALREIAERLGIAYETARTHLKTIFRKVGVNGQGELTQRVGALTE